MLTDINYNSFNFVFIDGEECTNNEDFNGTVFGKFRCPLPIPEPDFDPSAKYCCGTNQTQYCCRYFDEYALEIFKAFVFNKFLMFVKKN